MSFDSFFAGSTVVRSPRYRGCPRAVMAMSDPERLEAIRWASGLAPWCVAADMTFGSGRWRGKAVHRRRKEQRDLLVCMRRRGFDPDDALDLYRRWMQRVLPHVTWFAGVEPNPDHSGLNPGFHLHTMWAECDDVHRMTAARKWVEDNGICKIALMRSRIDAENYCTKHLIRRGSIFSYRIASSGLWHAARAR